MNICDTVKLTLQEEIGEFLNCILQQTNNCSVINEPEFHGTSRRKRPSRENVKFYLPDEDNQVFEQKTVSISHILKLLAIIAFY